MGPLSPFNSDPDGPYVAGGPVRPCDSDSVVWDVVSSCLCVGDIGGSWLDVSII